MSDSHHETRIKLGLKAINVVIALDNYGQPEGMEIGIVHLRGLCSECFGVRS